MGWEVVRPANKINKFKIEMPQIDLITYGSAVFFIYAGFWSYFVVCVVSSTVVFQQAVFNLFYGYACLLPAYSR